MVVTGALETALDLTPPRAASLRGSFLRYKADRLPVAFVLSMLGIHLAIWWFASPIQAAMAILPLAAASTMVAAFNHHHQHVNAFRFGFLNRLYDIALAVQSGVGPYAWVLHHNLGHHLNYLNQPPHAQPDQSRWARADGTQMGRLEYTFHTWIRHPLEIHRVGMRFPRLYKRYWLMKVPVYAMGALAFYLSPLNTLLAFVVPGLLVVLHTCWATYEHHAGQHATDHVDASVNREHRLFNLLTCNLGLHTAHHTRPGLHWSLLPELHAELRPRIPERQLLQAFW